MKNIILAVTGASAQPLAEKAIKLLLRNNYSVYLILSKGSYEVWKAEEGLNVPTDSAKQQLFWRERVKETGGKLICRRWNDNSSEIASGSFKTDAMVIVPCTMGTLGRIASGVSHNLIERCADVHLKEGRPLIIAPRESPLSIIHIDNMKKLLLAGARIVPPIPAWYSNPRSLDDMITFLIVRLFDSIDADLDDIERWEGPIK